ncbi:uncharacterized protein LOC119114311 [Pollicipes pollicipes]|uniref:uncharacterized protein LOC119114311 n=1 Tax=Pollicipes pollicipes TaxID=41117 RepID=UPI001884F06F|nr:uncharacterized protein LOC119114311 [Pollicipes pollicipes]
MRADEAVADPGRSHDHDHDHETSDHEVSGEIEKALAKEPTFRLAEKIAARKGKNATQAEKSGRKGENGRHEEENGASAKIELSPTEDVDSLDADHELTLDEGQEPPAKMEEEAEVRRTSSGRRSRAPRAWSPDEILKTREKRPMSGAEKRRARKARAEAGLRREMADGRGKARMIRSGGTAARGPKKGTASVPGRPGKAPVLSGEGQPSGAASGASEAEQDSARKAAGEVAGAEQEMSTEGKTKQAAEDLETGTAKKVQAGEENATLDEERKMEATLVEIETKQGGDEKTATKRKESMIAKKAEREASKTEDMEARTTAKARHKRAPKQPVQRGRARLQRSGLAGKRSAATSGTRRTLRRTK